MNISDSNFRPPLSGLSPNGMAGWIAKLKPETLEDGFGDMLRQLLQSLSQNCVPPDKGVWGLTVLLKHEEYAAFVDTFNAIHKLEEAQHPIDQGPYQRKLQLPLYGNDEAGNLAGLLDALSQIKVDILEAYSPSVSGKRVPLTATACAAIAALLEAGLTELLIDGVPSHYLDIAKALPGSQLQSITLGGDVMHYCVVTDDDMRGFETLLQGLTGCVQLKKLVICHPRLPELHESVTAFFDHPRCPQLEEIRIGTSFCSPQEVATFLPTLCQLSTLSSILVSTQLETAAELHEELLEPLRGHRTLKQLNILATAVLPWYDDSDGFVPTLLSFAATCPSLTHVGLKNGQMTLHGAVDAIEEFLFNGGDLEATDAAEATAEAFAQGGALTSLAFGRLLLTPMVVRALADELVKNTTIERFDVSDALTDLASFLHLLDAVKKSKSIRYFVIPEMLDNLYFLSPDGNTYGFEWGPLLTRNGKPRQLKLKFQADVTDEEKATANEALVRLQQRVDNIATDIEMHRRRMLEPVVSDFMNAAMLAQPQGADFSFAQVAPSVITALAKSDLSTAFRLNEVRKPREVVVTPTTTTTTTDTTSTAAATTTTTTTTTTTGTTTATSTGATTATGLQPSRERRQ